MVHPTGNPVCSGLSELPSFSQQMKIVFVIFKTGASLIMFLNGFQFWWLVLVLRSEATSEEEGADIAPRLFGVLFQPSRFSPVLHCELRLMLLLWANVYIQSCKARVMKTRMNISQKMDGFY